MPRTEAAKPAVARRALASFKLSPITSGTVTSSDWAGDLTLTDGRGSSASLVHEVTDMASMNTLRRSRFGDEPYPFPAPIDLILARFPRLASCSVGSWKEFGQDVTILPNHRDDLG